MRLDDEITVVPFSWRNHHERDEMLRQLVQAYGSRPAIRMFTMDVMRRYAAPERSPRGAARALHQFFRDNIPYVMEAGEQVVLPGILLAKQTGGDCDDQSLALASMLASIRTPVRFNYWKSDGPISHVSVGFWDGTTWVNVDPIVDEGFDFSPHGFDLVPGEPIAPDQVRTVNLSGLTADAIPGEAWGGIIGAVIGAFVAHRIIK